MANLLAMTLHACGITASGHKIQKGDKFVAADKLPFGTIKKFGVKFIDVEVKK